MKVCMLTSIDAKCGVADYSRDLAEELKVSVEIETVAIPQPFTKKAAIATAVRLNRGDLAHIQYHPALFGPWWQFPKNIPFRHLLKLTIIPKVVTIHDITFGVCRPRPDGFSKAGLKRFLRKYARFLIMKFRILVFKKYLLGTLRIPDHLIVHLSKTKAGLEKLGIGQDKISVIRLGNPRAAKSREHGFETDTKLLTIFGFIVPTKGYDIALRAIKALGRDDIHLVIGGGIRTVHDKAYYETLVKLIDASGIKVTLTHYLNKEEAFALLRRSTAILLPFRDTGTEVGSYSLSYAIAAEKPIIASDIPFFSEIAEHSKCITLFKEGDAGDLALTIDRVLGNVPYYEKLTRDYAGINSWNELSQKTISIYEKVRPLPPDCRS